MLRRARWRASNSGLRMEAACLTAAIMAGPRSLAVRVSRDAKVARMIAAGLGTIFDEVGNCSLRTWWPNCGSGRRASERGHFLVRQPRDAGQVGPLVVEGFQRGGVEEQRCAVLAAFAVERCGDEVAHAAASVDILGGKQPVIAAEVHAAAELKGLAQQAGRDTAGSCRRRGLREEDPDVRTPPRLRHLQRSRNLVGPCGFHIGQCVEHRGLFVEVCRDPPTCVIVAKRIQADMNLAAQVLSDDVGGQRKIRGVGAVHALAPVAADRRHPTGSTVAAILPTQRINVGATTKQIEEEADLVFGRRSHVDRRFRCSGQGGLIWICRAGLLFAQFE